MAAAECLDNMTVNRHHSHGLDTAAKSTEQRTLQPVSRLRPTCAGITFEGRVALAMEIWKSVYGYEGLYEVSNLGRVKATYVGNHGQYKSGRIVKESIHQNGYAFVTLYHPEKNPKARSIHSLVLEAFKKPRPPGAVARHLDRQRTHNTPENLEWGTSAENAADAKAHGTFVIGEKNGWSVLTEGDVREIRKLRDDGVPCVVIGKQFNTHWSNVWLIGKRRTWRHVQ